MDEPKRPGNGRSHTPAPGVPADDAPVNTVVDPPSLPMMALGSTPPAPDPAKPLAERIGSLKVIVGAAVALLLAGAAAALWLTAQRGAFASVGHTHPEIQIIDAKLDMLLTHFGLAPAPVPLPPASQPAGGVSP